jgi:hypothetical protein
MIKRCVYIVIHKQIKHDINCGLVLIDAELGRKDHSSTSATAIGRDWNHLMLKLTPNQIKLIVKAKNELSMVA